MEGDAELPPESPLRAVVRAEGDMGTGSALRPPFTAGSGPLFALLLVFAFLVKKQS